MSLFILYILIYIFYFTQNQNINITIENNNTYNNNTYNNNTINNDTSNINSTFIIPNCKIINTSNSKCQECEENFILVNGECPCYDRNCLKCSSSYYGGCSECKFGFILSSIDNSCRCKIKNCLFCSDNSCDHCEFNYTLKDGKCIKSSNDSLLCNDLNCKICSNSFEGSCLICKDGYELFKGKCRKNPISNIYINNTYLCPDGYFSVENGCNLNCLGQKCDKKNDLCENSCLKCNNYILSEKLNCHLDDYCEDKNCMQCRSKENGYCDRCNIGYFLRKGKCFKCLDKNCLNCDYTEIGWCNSCKNGFELIDGKCYNQSDNEATPEEEIIIIFNNNDDSDYNISESSNDEIEIDDMFSSIIDSSFDKENNSNKNLFYEDSSDSEFFYNSDDNKKLRLLNYNNRKLNKNFFSSSSSNNKNNVNSFARNDFLKYNINSKNIKISSSSSNKNDKIFNRNLEKNPKNISDDSSLSEKEEETNISIIITPKTCLKKLLKVDDYCVECNKNYTQIKGKCIKCSLENCNKCSLDNNCALCNPSYSLIYNKTLKKYVCIKNIGLVEHCNSYDEKDNKTCLSCEPFFSLNSSNNECVFDKMLEHQISYEIMSSNFEYNRIKTCEYGNYFNKETNSCTNCNDKNCKFCTFQIGCIFCKRGYHLIMGKCLNSTQFKNVTIEGCKIYDNEGNCLYCEKECDLSENKCDCNKSYLLSYLLFIIFIGIAIIFFVIIIIIFLRQDMKYLNIINNQINNDEENEKLMKRNRNLIESKKLQKELINEIESKDKLIEKCSHCKKEKAIFKLIPCNHFMCVDFSSEFFKENKIEDLIDKYNNNYNSKEISDSIDNDENYINDINNNNNNIINVNENVSIKESEFFLTDYKCLICNKKISFIKRVAYKCDICFEITSKIFYFICHQLYRCNLKVCKNCYNKIIELQKCPSCRNDIIIHNNKSNLVGDGENSNEKNNENNSDKINDNIEKKIK